MKFVGLFLLWCLLIVLCWPLAILALVLLPVVWLVSLPIRLVVFLVEALLATVRGIFLLPARLLGYKH